MPGKRFSRLSTREASSSAKDTKTQAKHSSVSRRKNEKLLVSARSFDKATKPHEVEADNSKPVDGLAKHAEADKQVVDEVRLLWPRLLCEVQAHLLRSKAACAQAVPLTSNYGFILYAARRVCAGMQRRLTLPLLDIRVA